MLYLSSEIFEINDKGKEEGMRREQVASLEVTVANDIITALDDGLQGMTSAEQAEVAITIIGALSHLKNIASLGYAITRYKALPTSNRNEVLALVRNNLMELRIGK